MPGLTEYLPQLNISKQLVFTFITWIVLLIIFAIVSVVATYLIVRRLKFNKTIIIFGRVGRGVEIIGKDKAMVMKMGRGGDTVFYSRKSKKYVPTPSIQTGRNTYWFFQRTDGEWINIGLEDVNEEMQQVQAHFLDKEMRYARVALQRNLKDRYDNPSFLQKYGGLLAYTALILVVGVVMWLWFDKIIDISSEVTRAIRLAADVNAETAKLLSGFSNIKSGSGLVPA